MKNTFIPTENRTRSLKRTLRTIRQRIFDMPEAQQTKAGRIIQKIKTRLAPIWPHSPATHWMYAAE